MFLGVWLVRRIFWPFFEVEKWYFVVYLEYYLETVRKLLPDAEFGKEFCDLWFSKAFLPENGDAIAGILLLQLSASLESIGLSSYWRSSSNNSREGSYPYVGKASASLKRLVNVSISAYYYADFKIDSILALLDLPTFKSFSGDSIWFTSRSARRSQ